MMLPGRRHTNKPPQVERPHLFSFPPTLRLPSFVRRPTPHVAIPTPSTRYVFVYPSLSIPKTPPPLRRPQLQTRHRLAPHLALARSLPWACGRESHLDRPPRNGPRPRATFATIRPTLSSQPLVSSRTSPFPSPFPRWNIATF
ncbi:hypothetical protein OF83DRAFT_145347 [Amylostereum chailletii]|nr:hypothetical protein OF83DRAFT_145347 [Amylostereum chailletii]